MFGKNSFSFRCEQEKRTVKVPISSFVLMPAIDEVLEDNVLQKRASFKTVDLRKDKETLKVSDFSFENLLAVGAVDSLRSVQFQPDRLSAQDQVLGAIEYVNSIDLSNVE